MLAGVDVEGLGKVGGILAGTISKAIGSGGKVGFGEVMGTASQFMALIPGPVGAVASMVTGVLGGALDGIFAKLERQREAGREAFMSVTTGARTTAQALNDLRTRGLQEGIESLVTRVQDWNVEGGLDEFIEGAAGRLDRSIAGRERAFNRIQNDPRIRGLQQQANRVQMEGVAADMTRNLERGVGQARVAADVVRGGGSTEEAGEAAQRLQLVQEYAERTRDMWETVPESIARANRELAPFLQQMQRSQEQARLFQQGGQLTQQLRSPLEAARIEAKRLERLLEMGAITQETFERAAGQQAQALIRAAGEVPVGQAVVTEGSAAAVSAINRAMRQAERNDPVREVARALEELEARQEEMVRVNRELAGALRAGRIFRNVPGFLGGG